MSSRSSSVYRRMVEKCEREILEVALDAHGWNVSAVARSLGLSRVGLSKRLRVLGIHRPRKAPRDLKAERLAKVHEAAREHPADCECWCCTTAPAPLAGEGARP